MNKYLFKTTTTMREYNEDKWWIDPNIVKDKYINAENLNEALKEYKDLVEKVYITISDNAIKNKTPMYVDAKDGKSKQIGYVLIGKMDFQADDQGTNWISQYIELWVEILTITETNFNI